MWLWRKFFRQVAWPSRTCYPTIGMRLLKKALAKVRDEIAKPMEWVQTNLVESYCKVKKRIDIAIEEMKNDKKL